MRKSLDLIIARGGRDFGIQGVFLGTLAIVVGLLVPAICWVLFFGIHQPEGSWLTLAALFTTLAVVIGFLFVCAGGVVLWFGINDIREANEEIELLLAANT
jgi:hypothetical protein